MLLYPWVWSGKEQWVGMGTWTRAGKEWGGGGAAFLAFRTGRGGLTMCPAN